MSEILSPAGSFDTAVAAIRAGADAIYFGSRSFNARRGAKNFSDEEIKEIATYSRIRGVKTYLTHNTLISDSERIEALKTVELAALSGVDALIVQDLGLARLVKKHFPNMPIHASTQLSIHSPDALELLCEMGFSRVVPAREMDRDSLRILCQKAKQLGLEVEVFIHGALCMCLSGQCYLSSMLGGRSGNRGLCAQPCRLDFGVFGGTGNDLSLKDMSLIKHLGELSEMGVASFKIEGRMKRPEYVAVATAVARAAANGEDIDGRFGDVLSGIFSRSGHTDGYYLNSLGRDMFGIRTETDQNLSAKLVTSTHELYRRERQSVALFGDFKLKKDSKAQLEIWDKDGNKAKVLGSKSQVAERVGITDDAVLQKLSKAGGTCYYFENITCDIDDGLWISGGEISALRNEAFEVLNGKRAEFKPQEFTPIELSAPQKVQTQGEPKIVAQFRNISQIPDDLSGVSAVVLPVESDFETLDIPKDIKVIADVPRGVIKSGKMVTEQLAKAKQHGVSAALCGNLASFKFAKGVGLPIVAGFGMNVYNTDSVQAVADLGAVATVLSFEANMAEINRMGGNTFKGIIGYGKLPLMIFKNCPGKNGGGCKTCGGHTILTDRKGIKFDVMCRGEFSEMFNSRPLWVLDRVLESGADFEVLMFLDETKEQCSEIINAAVLKKSPQGEYTRGLYYREVF